MSKFKTKKSLGQNFLQDINIINKIIAIANISQENNTLEIGPGQGALTTDLVKLSNQLLCVELDQRLINYLEGKYGDNDNFTLLNKDFLETVKEDFEGILDKPVKVVANLPYYITTPIILKILLEYEFVKELYVMVQKEVALRFTSEYKKKSYGSITVFLQSIANVEYEFDVKKELFSPIPKVDSAIISIKRKEINKLDGIDVLEYEKFLKACFKQKRKLLSNNLTSEYNMSKDQVNDFIQKLGYPLSIRPEEIKVDEYLSMYKIFKEDKKI